MEQKFNGLHPLKRFKLQHQQQPQEEDEEIPKSSYSLPAKKRKELRETQNFPSPPPFSSINNSNNTFCCLPAKKRVWASKPLLLLFNSPQKLPRPIASFDLNLEYQQSPQKVNEDDEKENLDLDLDLDLDMDLDLDLEVVKQHNTRRRLNSEEEEDDDDDDDGVLCGVCESTDGDPTDPIVFCDGCDLMVHATCYGDPLTKAIPEGDWFCATCQANNDSNDGSSSSSYSYTCCLCPPVKDKDNGNGNGNGGRVMKPTTDGRWAHIPCALFVPEVFFRDPEGRQGIDCSLVPSRRWQGICYVCGSNQDGCVIECSDPKCSLAFHVTCGLKQQLCIEYRESKGRRSSDKAAAGGIVVAFCKPHTQLWNKEQKTGKFKIVAREEHKK